MQKTFDNLGLVQFGTQCVFGVKTPVGFRVKVIMSVTQLTCNCDEQSGQMKLVWHILGQQMNLMYTISCVLTIKLSAALCEPSMEST